MSFSKLGTFFPFSIAGFEQTHNNAFSMSILLSSKMKAQFTNVCIKFNNSVLHKTSNLPAKHILSNKPWRYQKMLSFQTWLGAASDGEAPPKLIFVQGQSQLTQSGL
jgi:hypothetical protein